MADHDQPDKLLAYPSTRANDKSFAEEFFSKYEPYFRDSDLTEQQKRELLATLWDTFVDIVRFNSGLHPLQQACGKPEKSNSIVSADLMDALDCGQSQTSTKKASSAENTSQAAAEGVE